MVVVFIISEGICSSSTNIWENFLTRDFFANVDGGSRIMVSTEDCGSSDGSSILPYRIFLGGVL